jgi:hypothetical protein
MENITNMDANSLRSLWLKTFGRSPPLRATWFIQGNIQYHRQCQEQGGLTVATLPKLKQLADGRETRKTDGIRPGTKFVRVWQGQPHEVELLANGHFQYRGATFTSLSAIARHITGTAWSGNAFFGLNKVKTNGN